MGKDPMTELYVKYQNLIRYQAWKLSEKLNCSFDEALSDINMIFWDSVKSWKPERGAFTTFLFCCVHSHIINSMTAKSAMKRKNETLSDILDLITRPQPSPEKLVILKDLIEKDPVMNAIKELLLTEQKGYQEQKKGFKGWLSDKLFAMGFKWKDIWGAWKYIEQL